MTREPVPLAYTGRVAVSVLGVRGSSDELRDLVSKLEIVKDVGVLHDGTSDELRDLISKLEIAKDMAAKPDDYGPALEDLHIQLERAEAAAEALATYGAGRIEGLRVEFNSKTKRAKIVRWRENGGRPPDYHNELVADLAEATAERLEQETGKTAEPRRVCEEVARAYGSIFPPGYLDASPRGNIYNAWKNRERKRRKIVRQIDALAPSDEAVERLLRRSGLLIAPGAWRSTPFIRLLEQLCDVRLLEQLRDEAESEAALAALRRKLKRL